jgi:glycosyltransferase involved in cell wall biosynthesis
MCTENPDADIKMLVVGNKMYRTQAIDDTYNKMQYRERVVFMGHLDTGELNRVYSAAMALAYVSYFEGFGIPIVEAFQSDCPVITSKVTSMPEVAGDAAILVDPFNVEEIAAALSSLLHSGELRKELIEKGRRQVKKFSWDQSAEALWASLMRAVGN